MPSTLFYQTVGLSRLFPKSPRFGRHNLGHLPESELHEMDAGTAACLLLRRSALDRVGFFDPRYFMFGEDLDLCYRLKLGGWKVFLDHPDEVRRTICYIDKNPDQVGLPAQQWPFVAPYDGWPPHPGHSPNSPYARRLREAGHY